MAPMGERGKGTVNVGQTIADRDDLLLGSLLVRNKFLTQNQLDECLAAQSEVSELGMKMKLGEIVLQKGLVDAATLTATLRLQRLRMTGIRKAIEAEKRREEQEAVPIGELALDNGCITEEQLKEAVALQRQVRSIGLEKHLGEVLIEKGFVDRETLDSLLVIQEKRSSCELPAVSAPPPPKEEEEEEADPDSRLGALAVQNRIVTKAQLDKALEVQKQCLRIGVRMKLGETLLYLKYCTKKAIDSLAEIQGIRREGMIAGMEADLARTIDDDTLKPWLAKAKVPAQAISDGLKLQARLAQLGIHKTLAEILLDKQVIKREHVYELAEKKKKARLKEAPEPSQTRSQVILGIMLAVLVVGMALPILLRKKKTEEDTTTTTYTSGGATTTVTTAKAPTGGPLKAEVASGPSTAPVVDAQPVEEPPPPVDPLLVKAKSMLPSDRSALLEVVAWPVTIEGKQAFELLGYAALPDGAPVPTCLLFAGRPVAGSQKMVEVHEGYFATIFVPPSEGEVVLQGLYTAEAEFVLSLLLAKGGHLPKGQFLPERLVRRNSFLYGSVEGEQAEARQIAAIFRSVHGTLAKMKVDALGRAREVKSKPSDAALRGWNEAYAVWDKDLLTIEKQVGEHEKQVLAPRFPGLAEGATSALLPARRFLRVLTNEVYSACKQKPAFEEGAPGEFVSSVEVVGTLDRAIEAFVGQVAVAEEYKAGAEATTIAVAWIAEARALAQEAEGLLAGARKGFDAEGFTTAALELDARAAGLAGRDPGLATQVLKDRAPGFGQDFAGSIERLRAAFVVDARALLSAKGAEVPVAFRAAQGAGLGETLKTLSTGWDALEARLTK